MFNFLKRRKNKKIELNEKILADRYLQERSDKLNNNIINALKEIDWAKSTLNMYKGTDSESILALSLKKLDEIKEILEG